jgi:hypothetical protein
MEWGSTLRLHAVAASSLALSASTASTCFRYSTLIAWSRFASISYIISPVRVGGLIGEHRPALPASGFAQIRTSCDLSTGRCGVNGGWRLARLTRQKVLAAGLAGTGLSEIGPPPEPALRQIEVVWINDAGRRALAHGEPRVGGPCRSGRQGRRAIPVEPSPR